MKQQKIWQKNILVFNLGRKVISMKEIAIVTGAAMGNGLGITEKLCEKGVAVMMFDMSDEVFKSAEKL